MAPKAAHEAAKKKAAKQRKVLILLAVPLLAALVYAYMTMSGLGGGGGGGSQSVQPVPAAQTTPASEIPSASSAAPTLTPGVTAAPVDSLRSFVLLGRKDPFHD